ncbi:hypothetical protein KDL45_00980 [bacterium]|nr:hypothetical protein [bacterium]
MKLGQLILRRVAKSQNLTPAQKLFEDLTRLGQPSESPFPRELLPMAVHEAIRGAFNTQFFQFNLDWVLPYWAVRQFDPAGEAFIPRMSQIGLNQTHRNWTAIGTTKSTTEPVVDPAGLVTPWLDGWSLDTWVRVGDKTLFPSRHAAPKQTVHDPAPQVVTYFESDGVFLEVESFACIMRKRPVVMHRARVQNLTDETLKPQLYFAIRPYNPEGVSTVHGIRYFADGYFSVEGRLGVVFSGKPDRVVCSSYRDGDCSHMLDAAVDTYESACDTGLATAYARFTLTLGGGATAEQTLVMPIDGEDVKPATAMELRRFDYRDWRVRVHSQWLEVVDHGLSIEVPDADVQRLFALNKAYLCLFDDGDEICPGPLTYHHFWFRDAAIMIAALDKMGFPDRARQKLLLYPKKQKSDGFFQSQDGEWDSNGEAIWTLAEHFRMTGDEDFLNKVVRAIGDGARWIENKRLTKAPAGSPHQGLLPPGYSAEHFGPNDYYYWDDFWALAGLRDAWKVTEHLGYRSDYLAFEKMYEQMTYDLRASLKTVERRLGEALIPAGPYRRMDSGAIGSLVSVYPLRVLKSDDPLVVNTLNAIERVSTLDGAFFQHINHSGINPYLTMHMAQVHLMQGDPKGWALARKVMKMATPTGTWPEAINPRTGGGCMGDGHHGWAIAEWLLFVRNALLMENEDILVITPLLPREWTAWGQRVVVRSAPTHYGAVSFVIEMRDNEIVLNMAPEYRHAPRKLEWRLPMSVREALVDGQMTAVNGHRMQVPAGTKEIRVPRAGLAS